MIDRLTSKDGQLSKTEASTSASCPQPAQRSERVRGVWAHGLRLFAMISIHVPSSYLDFSCRLRLCSVRLCCLLQPAIVRLLLQQAGTVAVAAASCRAMRLSDKKRCVPLLASARKRSARSSRTSTAAHPFALASRSSLPPAPSPLHRELSFSFFKLHFVKVSEHARMRTHAEA